MFHRYKQVFIEAYGAYIPQTRVPVAQIGTDKVASLSASRNLGVVSKAQAQMDEDAVTLAWEAASTAIEKLPDRTMGSIYVGSESHPYAVKSTAGILAQALNLGTEVMAADLEHACKAGTAATQIVANQIEAATITRGLAIGSDVSQAHPGDVLEYTAGAGAAAIVLSSHKLQAKAQINASVTVTSDTPDFWRRAYQKYPQHAGRFSGEPGYFYHVTQATQQLLHQIHKKPEDFNHAVFHMPNGKFPTKVARQLGFTPKQLEAGFTVNTIGNPYSASSLIGLCQVMDQSKPGDQILMTSYGSGSGSDSFWIEVLK